jgi:hypothetical protein
MTPIGWADSGAEFRLPEPCRTVRPAASCTSWQTETRMTAGIVGDDEDIRDGVPLRIAFAWCRHVDWARGAEFRIARPTQNDA